MMGISFGEVHNTKVVHGKSEGGWKSAVLPEARLKGHRNVHMGLKVGLELFVCKNAGLFETVHTFTDFHVKVAFGVKVRIHECMLINDYLCNITAMDAHILKDFHGRPRKKSLMLPAVQYRAPCKALEMVELRDEVCVNDTNGW